MLKVEKLIEDIVNDIYRNSNNSNLINKKIHLSTDLDKLLYHVVHGGKIKFEVQPLVNIL